MPLRISNEFNRFDIPGLVSWWIGWGQFIGLLLMIAIVIWLIFGLNQKRSRWPFMVALLLLLFTVPGLLARFAPQAFLSFAGVKEPSAFASFVDNKDGVKDAMTRFGSQWLADENLRDSVRRLSAPGADATKILGGLNRDSTAALSNLDQSTLLMSDPDRTALLKSFSDALVWVQAATYLGWAVLLITLVLAFTPLFLRSPGNLMSTGTGGYINMPSPAPDPVGINPVVPGAPTVFPANTTNGSFGPDSIEQGRVAPTRLDQMGSGNEGGGFNKPRVARTILDMADDKPLALLVVKEGARRGTDFKLGEENELGRDPERCNIVLDDGKISSNHAKIRLEKTGWFIYDLASRNKTFVNNEEIVKQSLKDGDRIRLGDTVLAFIEIDD